MRLHIVCFFHKLSFLFKIFPHSSVFLFAFFTFQRTFFLRWRLHFLSLHVCPHTQFCHFTLSHCAPRAGTVLNCSSSSLNKIPFGTVLIVLFSSFFSTTSDCDAMRYCTSVGEHHQHNDTAVRELRARDKCAAQQALRLRALKERTNWHQISTGSALYRDIGQSWFFSTPAIACELGKWSPGSSRCFQEHWSLVDATCECTFTLAKFWYFFGFCITWRK